jgi:Mor family transcriptional regulator
MTIEFYTVLSNILNTQLSEQNIPAKKAQAIKDGLLAGIRNNLAGHSVYFKTTVAKEKATDRHKAICAEFDGSNHGELMTKYGIGHDWLRKIIKRGESHE